MSKQPIVPLSLIKLHGSIGNYKVSEGNNLTRIHKLTGVWEFYKEVWNEEKQAHEFRGVWDDVAPDFLSGANHKITFYKSDPYYKCLFENFEKNLQSSEKLFVIGYGFQDSGINSYLEQSYLSNEKEMIVVEPFQLSQQLTALTKQYRVTIESKGIEAMGHEDFARHM